MTAHSTRDPAEERLLDAALQQLYRSDSDVTELSAPPAQRGMWLRAAILLLGLSITGTALWQSRGEPPITPITPQDPKPFGFEVKVEGEGELAALPDSTSNLTCSLVVAGSMKLLPRFRALRRLQIVAKKPSFAGSRAKSRHSSWREPAHDLFEPLATLQALESLTLPFGVSLTATHLTPLRKCAKLRELVLMGSSIDLTADFVTALDQLTHLNSLQLDLVRLDPDSLKRIRALRLQRLGLSRCPGFDAETFGELCEMNSLRELSFRDLGRKKFGDESARLWMPSPDEVARLAKLPELSKLAIRNCAFGVEEVRALPDRLVSLELHGLELNPEQFGELRRFGLLRELSVSTARYSIGLFGRDSDATLLKSADGLAEALADGGLRLRKFTLTGQASDELLRQLARQPELREITIDALTLPNLDELGNARALRKLTLHQRRSPSPFGIEDLRELAACKSLRELVVGGTIEFDQRSVQSALGGNIAVRVEPYGK